MRIGMILTLNAGSSSLKFALFQGNETAKLRGSIEGLGQRATVTLHGDQAALNLPDLAGQPYEAVLAALLDALDRHLGNQAIGAVGHRIVHGGARFQGPVRIDAGVLAALDGLVKLAPLHQPHGLAAIHAIAKTRPGLPQVGCFDTAFHRTMPKVATQLALPAKLADAALRRYGFHGLSYEFVADRLRAVAPALAQGRVIVAHLGSGASLCAMRDGCSVETTMGFSTLDGLVMATRPGALDPGALLYLLQSHALSAAALENLLYHQSGLLGVSGLSGDMRALAASSQPAARDAIDLFVYRLCGEIGRLAAALGGLDGLVFTAGIGEHNAALRVQTCRHLAWLGIVPDPDANTSVKEGGANTGGAKRISRDGSPVAVWVVPTDEEIMIARHTQAALSD